MEGKSIQEIGEETLSQIPEEFKKYIKQTTENNKLLIEYSWKAYRLTDF